MDSNVFLKRDKSRPLVPAAIGSASYVDAHEVSAEQSLAGLIAGAALCSSERAAAIGDSSPSYWHAEVAAGRAPKPVIQQHRFTRWKLIDVLAYWERLAQEGSAPERRAAHLAITDKAARTSRRTRSVRGDAASSASA